MTIHVMDIFYMIMIAIIFGFIIHLETQCKMILEILEQQSKYKSCREDFPELEETQLDK